MEQFSETEHKEIILGNGDRVSCQDAQMLLLFAGERAVICTGPLGGGIRYDLSAVFNHCDMDPVSHYCEMKGDTYEQHLRNVAIEAGLDPEHCAGLTTACRMDTMYMANGSVMGIGMNILLTGGINKNGRCAGDRASLWEENGVFTVLDNERMVEAGADGWLYTRSEEHLIPQPGTINMIVHIEADLSPGALAGAIMVATEAKNAVIRKMEIKSQYSEDTATGSGTDGVIIVADTQSERHITQIRTDTAAGELIAVLIRKALESVLTRSMLEEDTSWYIP